MTPKTWTVDTVRKTFLDYFIQRDHTEVPSSPLLPAQDRTLLFTNAGMNQFKNVFTGSEKRSYSRACSAQKCVRAGGKHNDLENVGFTARHHTFFEMLGNFSFGDYFKTAAVDYAWELVTDVFGINQDRLYATVFKDDDKAYELWRTRIGLPEERVFRLGEKDNFWSMGETGPCGPCSELHYDLGDSVNVKKPFIKNSGGIPEPDWDCGRFVEIWNLVFMQYERDSNGAMTPLPNPSVDTGMGLERITAILNEKTSNYDISLFKSIVSRIAELSGTQPTPEIRPSFNVIADHARATCFLIADSITPSNEGRGYVLRRIMRRAIRHGNKIGFTDQFFVNICSHVIELMGNAYPELKKQRDLILNITVDEEQRFGRTLRTGLSLLSREMETLREKGSTTLSGDVVFTLYDTYGFPPDLTRTILAEEQMDYNPTEFETAMGKQRDRGRNSWSGDEEPTATAAEHLRKKEIPETNFIGYNTSAADGTVLTLFSEDFTPVDEITQPDTQGYAVLSPAVFYAEAGGQAADTGSLRDNDDSVIAEVTGCVAIKGRSTVRLTTKQPLHVNDSVKQVLDEKRRNAVRRNHSATHLLHLALRRTVGDHANQAGSLVEPDRLRFDFNHYDALSEKELRTIETQVNDRIMRNDTVNTAIESITAARERGAMALFGEKYGESVRVVSMGDSIELCGGTHVSRTGDIGMFAIVREEGIAAGVRRIEALTGHGALNHVRKTRDRLSRLAGMLNTSPDNASDVLEKLRDTEKKQRREIKRLREKLSSQEAAVVEPDFTHDNVEFYVLSTDKGREEMISLSDSVRSRVENGVFIIRGEQKKKSALIVSISGKKAAGQFNAGKIIKKILGHFNGRGGGRPDMAQGGADNIPADELRHIVNTMFNS